MYSEPKAKSFMAIIPNGSAVRGGPIIRFTPFRNHLIHTQQILFQWQFFAYNTHSFRCARVYQSTFLPLRSGSTLPPDCIPIDATRIMDGWRIGRHSPLSIPTPPDLPLSFQPFRNTWLPYWTTSAAFCFASASPLTTFMTPCHA